MNIDEMSIADVKASLDFIREFIVELKDKAKKEGIRVEQIPAYPESTELENKLYHRLLNTVRMLN